jgi:hypothetical protein
MDFSVKRQESKSFYNLQNYYSKGKGEKNKMNGLCAKMFSKIIYGIIFLLIKDREIMNLKARA